MPFSTAAGQILIGRGDDANIDMNRRLAPDPVKLAFSEDAQTDASASRLTYRRFHRERPCRHCACSKRPMRRRSAPVNAPRSWPNNSDSSRSEAIAVVLNATNGLLARGLCSCNACATNSLPVPDSPVIKTFMLDPDNSANRAKHFLHGWRLADNRRQTCAADRGILFERLIARPGRTPYEVHGLIDIERLRQIFECAALIGRHGAVQIRMRRHDDDGQIVTNALRAGASFPGHPCQACEYR